MPGSGPTKNQISFIAKLIGESPSREKIQEDFLRSVGKGSIDELTVQETSQLIDRLKNAPAAEGEKSQVTGPLATGKQISFLTSLQSTEERMNAAREFLKRVGKPNINLLTMQEASELIEKLKSIEMRKGQDTSGAPVTPKQVKYIGSLMAGEDKKKVAELFLKKINKKDVGELNRREASQLIDLLK